MLGGNDMPASAVGGIWPALHEVGPFQVVQEVRHDRPVDAETPGKGALTPGLALHGG